MDIDINDEKALRLADFNDQQLRLEINLLNSILSQIPYYQLPKVFLEADQLSKLIIPDTPLDKVFSTLHIVFLRLLKKIKVLKQYNELYFFTKGYIEVEVDEKLLRLYMVKLNKEMAKRDHNSDTANGPSLAINTKSGEVTYKSKTGQAKTALLSRSELEVFLQLAKDRNVPIETKKIKLTKKPRGGAKYADFSRRVIDKISRIRKKLANEVIITKNGYMITCEVSFS